MQDSTKQGNTRQENEKVTAKEEDKLRR